MTFAELFKTNLSLRKKIRLCGAGDISPKIAKDFISRITEGKNYITQNPYGDDVMYKEIRMHNIRQFPYHIHYQIIEKEMQILILAIEFSKRDNLDFSGR